MKIGRKTGAKSVYTKPNKNQSKKNMMLVAVVAVTVLLIIWVYAMGRKAEDTVSVVMWNTPIYKNQTITDSMMTEYKMLKGEFEKYAVTAHDGSKTRRIVLWEEKDKLINTFAAYSLQQDTIAMIKDVITSRTDNSDAVLYSFPGKNIVQLEVGSDALQSFKAYLEPGDRINITAIYTVENKADIDGYENETLETTQQQTVFKDIMLADLLNSSGNSILDIYASYNEMTQYQQASMDSSETFQDSVTPSTMLVALTPEEEALYYDYLSKDSVEFVVSMPQRTE